MKNIKLATVALNQLPLDWDGNEARLHEALKAIKAEQVQLASTSFT